MKEQLKTMLHAVQAPGNAEEKIAGHIALVLKWGRSMNLTGATTPEELFNEHVMDALPLAGLLSPGEHLLDVGSGAGFPGVIVAIVRPDVEVTLLENNHKKAVFLRTALREAACVGRALDGDVFQPPSELGGPFSAVVSRAVFAPSRWVEIGAGFVAPTGSLYALLGREDAPPTPEGFEGANSYEYKLASGARRAIAVYKKRAKEEHGV